jgi:hypothetical protein
MVVVEIATAIFAGISALSDTIHLYSRKREQGRTPSSAEIDRSMKKAETAARANPDAAKELSQVIDDEILNVINSNIQKEKDRLKKSLSDPANDNAAKDKAIDIANSTICAELSRIKRLNGGNLPSEYEKFWTSHACA